MKRLWFSRLHHHFHTNCTRLTSCQASHRTTHFSGLSLYCRVSEAPPFYLFKSTEDIIGARSEQICSIDGCLRGKSSSNSKGCNLSRLPLESSCAHRLVLHTDTSSRTRFAPGVYRATGQDSSFPSSVTSAFNQTVSRTADSITLGYPDRPVTFSGAGFRGSSDTLAGSGWTAEGWRSLYAPPDWYSVVGEGDVLWGQVAEVEQLPPNTPLRISSASSCEPLRPCAAV